MHLPMQTRKAFSLLQLSTAWLAPTKFHQTPSICGGFGPSSFPWQDQVHNPINCSQASHFANLVGL